MYNINPETGIAYGYIAANSLESWVVDEILYGAKSTNHSYEEAVKEAIETARSIAEEQDALDDFDEEDIRDEFNQEWEDDEPFVSASIDGVEVQTSWLGGALNFFVLKSPYITETAGYASPCVPNAGILDSEGGVRAYDVPPEWRFKGAE